LAVLATDPCFKFITHFKLQAISLVVGENWDKPENGVVAEYTSQITKETK